VRRRRKGVDEKIEVIYSSMDVLVDCYSPRLCRSVRRQSASLYYVIRHALPAADAGV